MNQFSEESSFELGARFDPARDMVAERSEDKDKDEEAATSSADI
jgi:hypothetical protein